MAEEKIQSFIDDAVAEVARVMRDNPRNDGWPAARRLMKTLPDEVMRHIVMTWLHEQAVEKVRYQSLAEERAAEKAAAEKVPYVRGPRPEPGPDGLKHGSINAKNGGVPAGCDCQSCETVREIEKQGQIRLHASLSRILDDYADRLRIEWTAELLASTFALPDGTRILWGEATLAQHEERLQMLVRNAEANLEAAARHRAAMAAIVRADALCLNEVVTHQEKETQTG